MFSSLNLFSQLSCPDEANCRLPTCLFRHGRKGSHTHTDSLLQSSHLNGRTQETEAADEGNENEPRKKRKIIGANGDLRAAKTALDKKGEESIRGRQRASPNGKAKDPRVQADKSTAVESARKAISPPPLRKGAESTPRAHHNVGATSSTISERDEIPRQVRDRGAGKQESLNPRLLERSPATHGFRLVILSKLHEEFQRLNEEYAKLESPTKWPSLSLQDLIKMALDEEEKVALETPSLYSNVIKNRIMTYKRMKAEEWAKSVLEPLFNSSKSVDTTTGPITKEAVVIETGLTDTEEIAVLPRLLAPEKVLAKSGYVVHKPTNKAVEEASQGVRAAQGWEVCDRCKMRFQVFPGRRDDGSLTTGGKCSYHWGKAFMPTKNRNEAQRGQVEKRYTCCQEGVGISPGCTSAESHVFKISEVKRLASVLQFEETPPTDPSCSPQPAVCFDCEMCYTAYGLELVRMTATAWPSGEEILDTLVRPFGEILDLNSRFSGVWPTHMASARPYNPGSDVDHVEKQSTAPQKDTDTLPIVSSPAAARSLFFKYLSPQTSLIGHALENDLNVTRIIHPKIIDTALLFPHRAGLPFRHSLKMLMSKHLERDIQLVDSKTGHDSKEDARAAGDLVRWKIAQEWKKLKREGWTFRNGELLGPGEADNRGSGERVATTEGGTKKRSPGHLDEGVGGDDNGRNDLISEGQGKDAR
ncbi:MAG: RNA exonuclease 3 [Sclerophora amabilis]|nr:MAG: RNA exonuclease 3 [Sclerophora amabilis]